MSCRFNPIETKIVHLLFEKRKEQWNDKEKNSSNKHQQIALRIFQDKSHCNHRQNQEMVYFCGNFVLD